MLSESVKVAATGDITTATCMLRGIHVRFTGADTITIRRGGSAGTVMAIYTAAAATGGAHYDFFDVLCEDGVHATIAAGNGEVTAFLS